MTPRHSLSKSMIGTTKRFFVLYLSSAALYRRGTDERNGQEKQRLWISIKHREPQTLIPKKTSVNLFCNDGNST